MSKSGLNPWVGWQDRSSGSSSSSLLYINPAINPMIHQACAIPSLLVPWLRSSSAFWGSEVCRAEKHWIFLQVPCHLNLSLPRIFVALGEQGLYVLLCRCSLVENWNETYLWNTHSIEKNLAKFVELAFGSINPVCLREHSSYCGTSLHGARVWTQADAADEPLTPVHGMCCSCNHYGQSAPQEVSRTSTFFLKGIWIEGYPVSVSFCFSVGVKWICVVVMALDPGVFCVDCNSPDLLLLRDDWAVRNVHCNGGGILYLLTNTSNLLGSVFGDNPSRIQYYSDVPGR